MRESRVGVGVIGVGGISSYVHRPRQSCTTPRGTIAPAWTSGGGYQGLMALCTAMHT